MSVISCDECHGKRLSTASLAVTVGDMSISDFCEKSVSEALASLDRLELAPRESMIAKTVLKEIKSRLGFSQSVGLEHLMLSRSAGMLSGGESQHIRLTI